MGNNNHEEHNIHAVAQPAHEALSELIKEDIKDKLNQDPKISSNISELANAGYQLISHHLDEITKKIKDELSEAHH